MVKTYSELLKELDRPLDPSLVATRDMSWGKVDYLETNEVIRQANRIFEYGRWERTITMQPTAVAGGFMAAVRVVVWLPDEQGAPKSVTHEDVGFRSVSKEGLEETAIKGCVSDALKRTLRAFGPQFGLDIGMADDEEGHTKNPATKAAEVKHEEKRSKARVADVMKTDGEPYPYELRFRVMDSDEEKILPCYTKDLHTLVRAGDSVELIVVRSAKGNEYVKAVKKNGG